MNDLTHNEILDALVSAGLSIRGREHIDGIVARGGQNIRNNIVNLFVVGRKYGIYFFKDQASFDQKRFISELPNLGFARSQTQAIVANLNPAPAPETTLLNIGE